MLKNIVIDWFAKRLIFWGWFHAKTTEQKRKVTQSADWFVFEIYLTFFCALCENLCALCVKNRFQ